MTLVLASQGRQRRPLWNALTAALLTMAPAAPAAPTVETPKAAPVKSLLEGVELFELWAPHSQIEFSVAWMGLSRVRGTFTQVSGTLLIDRDDLTRSSATIAIDTRSLTTWNEDRDRDLKSPDWFDVEKYPVALFGSREVEKTADGYVMHGSLTLHGVTKDLEIPFVFNGRIKDKWGNERVGFEGQVRLNRKEFGIVGPTRWNLITELGKATVGEEVEIPLAVEGGRPFARETMMDRTSDSLWRAIEARGVPAAASQYREASARTPDTLMAVNDGVLNAVGHQLLQRGKASEALAVFTLEAEAFPQSAIAASGLAQAHATLGHRSQAIATAERAIVMDSRATLARAILNHVRGAPGD